MSRVELKNAIFGYSKKSVHVLQQKWDEDKTMLERQLKDKDQVIEKMQQEILSYRKKELLISESILEAKDMARDIVLSAEKSAEKLKNETVEKLNQQVAEHEVVMQRLHALKHDMITQEKGLKHELMDVLAKYMTHLESVDMSEFASHAQMMKSVEQTQQELVQNAKNISKKVVVLPTRQQSIQEADMPIYTFK
ncbi:hypothetical protein IR114_00515 [Granulicatella sp. 19428wC4_WM01]|nr:hypothetical protein [Granulicatella sp. 19428wC4_WM01]